MSTQEPVAVARVARQQSTGSTGPRGSDWAPSTSNSRAPQSGAGNPHYAARRQSSNDSACSAQATPEHCDLHCKVLPSYHFDLSLTLSVFVVSRLAA